MKTPSFKFDTIKLVKLLATAPVMKGTLDLASNETINVYPLEETRYYGKSHVLDFFQTRDGRTWKLYTIEGIKDPVYLPANTEFTLKAYKLGMNHAKLVTLLLVHELNEAWITEFTREKVHFNFRLYRQGLISRLKNKLSRKSFPVYLPSRIFVVKLSELNASITVIHTFESL